MTKSVSDLLHLRRVGKSFPGVRALDGIDLLVRAGEVHAVVGENGAGKSTLMAVASGALPPDEGEVRIAGVAVDADPERVRDLGFAIVRQEPALMPDLTVAENLFVGVSAKVRPPAAEKEAWARRQLALWSDLSQISSRALVSELAPEQRFVVEIVKALAGRPRILVLDEPTEHLGVDDTERLFAVIRRMTESGGAVIYISHRIREVRHVAHRVTVLRDGRSQGTYEAADFDEDQLIALIVGRQLGEEFPPKPARSPSDDVVLEVRGLSGRNFGDVDLDLRRGEILGLAGIDGNGQRELVRALAGLLPSQGRVLLDGQAVRRGDAHAAARSGIAYLSGDRHRESIFADLSIMENFSLRSLAEDRSRGFISAARGRRRAEDAFQRLRVKAPETGTPIALLSGGNQQKVVLAGVLAAHASVLIVEEPTQGVDVGARADIYRILREAGDAGMAIVLLSSDAAELAGLSDRVAVFSRGVVADTIEGEAVDESAITAAALRAATSRNLRSGRTSGLRGWAGRANAPLVMLLAATLALGAAAALVNPFFVSPRSLAGMMTLAATLALVGYGQQIVVLIGGIDLSVGPLMGLATVIASFFLLADASGPVQLLGWSAIFAAAVAVGIANWILIVPLALHPMVATLASFMVLQAVSLMLREVPEGVVDPDVMLTLGIRFGFVPASFLVALAIGLGLEFWLRRSLSGIMWRGFGSRPEEARMAGAAPRRLILTAYVGSALLSALAAVTMIQQVGIGDPRAGLGYVLASIAAVVIGGTSLAGGRGSFLATFLGAIFITEVNAVTTFVNLDQAWQNYLLGTMILLSVVAYSAGRTKEAA